MVEQKKKSEEKPDRSKKFVGSINDFVPIKSDKEVSRLQALIDKHSSEK